jgi:hypothetical protein
MSRRVFLLMYQQPWRAEVDIEGVFSTRVAAERALTATEDPDQYWIDEHQVRDA